MNKILTPFSKTGLLALLVAVNSNACMNAMSLYEGLVTLQKQQEEGREQEEVRRMGQSSSNSTPAQQQEQKTEPASIENEKIAFIIDLLNQRDAKAKEFNEKIESTIADIQILSYKLDSASYRCSDENDMKQYMLHKILKMKERKKKTISAFESIINTMFAKLSEKEITLLLKSDTDRKRLVDIVTRYSENLSDDEEEFERMEGRIASQINPLKKALFTNRRLFKKLCFKKLPAFLAPLNLKLDDTPNLHTSIDNIQILPLNPSSFEEEAPMGSRRMPDSLLEQLIAEDQELKGLSEKIETLAKVCKF